MHIVIFTGGDYPAPEKVQKYFMANKPNKIIAADSGLDVAIKYIAFYGKTIDFSPDYILGDMDSVSNKSLPYSFNAEINLFEQDKYYTDTEIALLKAYELKTNCNEKSIITLIGGAGQRIDHLLGIYDTFSEKYHADVWLYGEQKLIFIKENLTYLIQNIKEGEPISISRQNGQRTGGVLTSKGLEWESKLFRNIGMPSISNRVSMNNILSTKQVEITASKEGFLLIVPISASICVDDCEL